MIAVNKVIIMVGGQCVQQVIEYVEGCEGNARREGEGGTLSLYDELLFAMMLAKVTLLYDTATLEYRRRCASLNKCSKSRYDVATAAGRVCISFYSQLFASV